MVKITNKSQEFSNLEVYNMTKSHKLNTLKNLENGAKLEVAGFMEWEDVNEETGESTELMSLLTTDGDAYVTQSDTFKRDFFDIVEIFEHNFPITIEHGVGKSKAGREYHYCAVQKGIHMEQMIDLLVNSGVAVAVIAYFCIRDWRFTDQISRTLSAIETLLKHEESEEDKK